MSDAAAPAPAPSAPSAAPASAPSAPSAPAQQNRGIPPTAQAPHPPSGIQEAPDAPPPATPKRDPVPWKTKHAFDDLGEREIEIDVAPFLADYKRKIKLDGEEVEVGLEDAYKSTERFKSSMKRFQEAAQARRELEQREKDLTEKTRRLEERLTSPTEFARIAPKLLQQQTGPTIAAMLRADPSLLDHVAPVIRERLEYEQMPDDQRRRYDAAHDLERRAQEREYELARQARALEEREQRIKAEEEAALQRETAQARARTVAEWTPMIEAAGLSAKIGDKVNTRLFTAIAGHLKTARDAGYPMTVQEAIAAVREEIRALSGSTQQRAVEQATAQPGRGEPMPPPAQRAPRVQRIDSAEDFERRLRESWRR